MPSPSSPSKGAAASGKRKATTQSVSRLPPPVKRKIQSTTSKNAIASFFTPTSQKPKSKTAWAERAPPKQATPPTLLIGRYATQPKASFSHGLSTGDCASAPKPFKIAAFDLDSTLITTASGKKYGNDPGDWKWWDPIVPTRLQQLHSSEGYLVVIFSNQAGLTLHPDPKSKAPKKNSELRVENFKTKGDAILSALDLPPLTIYAATGKDIFRKPRTGMWTAMCEDLNIRAEEVDLDASFFIGDAGGRTAVIQPDTGKGGSMPKDFSCSDRNFAHNLGIRFQTPEEYFHGHKPRDFTRDIYLDRFPYAEEEETGVECDAVFVESQEKEVVLFCGPPGAGKSTFYRNHLEKLGYVRVNQDNLKSKDKCFKVAAEHLKEGRWIVIDNTNPDPDTRRQWVLLAERHAVSIRCIWFKTSIPLCEHNNVVRALNGDLNPESREMLPKLAFNGFTSRYKEPKLQEGFQDIIQVDFKFQGTQQDYKIWCKYWV